MNIQATNFYADSWRRFNLLNLNNKRSESVNRISTGTRIHSSSEDPSGVGVSYKIKGHQSQHSSLRKNLNNALSYLETQAEALRVLEKILNRITEINVLKQDSTIQSQDSLGYNAEMDQLVENIKRIREETFNGIRLFSPEEQSDSINAHTFQIDGTSIELSRPPLPFDPEPLEIVFLIDFSWSMSPYWNSVKNNIDTFVNQLNNNNNIKDWKAKIVGYPATSFSPESNPANGLGNTFVNSADSLKAQIDAMPRATYGQGEPLIEALDAVINNAGFSSSGTQKGIIAITDEPITESAYALNNRDRVANELKDQNINFTLLTEGYPGGFSGDVNYNYLTTELMNDSGGVLQDLTNSFSNPTDLFTTLADRLVVSDVPFDSEILSSFVVENGAAQTIVKNKLSSLESINFNLGNVDQIASGIDIAKESLSLLRNNILYKFNMHLNVMHNIQSGSYFRLVIN